MTAINDPVWAANDNPPPIYLRVTATPKADGTIAAEIYTDVTALTEWALDMGYMPEPVTIKNLPSG